MQPPGKGGPPGPRPGADGKPATCKFGFYCQRAGCWYQHPEGRKIDQNPLASLCRDGKDCKRVDCWRVHPPEREDIISEKPIDMCLWLDEVPMPNRPQVLPSLADREVFLEMVGPVGSPELNDFLTSFGPVEDVFQLPGQQRGYVRFMEHSAAANCVSLGAGFWSESERALSSDQPSLQGTSCYPESLVVLIGGTGSNVIQSLMEKSGVRNLRLHAGGRMAHAGGVIGRTESSDYERVCYSCKGFQIQMQKLKAALQEMLEGAHMHLTCKAEENLPREVEVSGLPDPWVHSEIKKFFSRHGFVERLQRGYNGKALVVYRTGVEARAAAQSITGTELPGHPGVIIECQLQTAGMADSWVPREEKERRQRRSRSPRRFGKGGQKGMPMDPNWMGTPGSMGGCDGGFGMGGYMDGSVMQGSMEMGCSGKGMGTPMESAPLSGGRASKWDMGSPESPAGPSGFQNGCGSDASPCGFGSGCGFGTGCSGFGQGCGSDVGPCGCGNGYESDAGRSFGKGFGSDAGPFSFGKNSKGKGMQGAMDNSSSGSSKGEMWMTGSNSGSGGFGKGSKGGFMDAGSSGKGSKGKIGKPGASLWVDKPGSSLWMDKGSSGKGKFDDMAPSFGKGMQGDGDYGKGMKGEMGMGSMRGGKGSKSGWGKLDSWEASFDSGKGMMQGSPEAHGFNSWKAASPGDIPQSMPSFQGTSPDMLNLPPMPRLTIPGS